MIIYLLFCYLMKAFRKAYSVINTFVFNIIFSIKKTYSIKLLGVLGVLTINF